MESVDRLRWKDLLGNRILMLAAAIWTVLVVYSLVRVIQLQHRFERESALNEARITFQNDVIYQHWLAERGLNSLTAGPQVKLDPRDKAPIGPMPGYSLRRVNPAVMQREAFAFDERLFGRYQRITSLRPLNPANSPDAWERKALTELTAGRHEYNSVEDEKGREILRYMGSLSGGPECMSCHQAGSGPVPSSKEFEAGISIKVPLKPFRHLGSPLTSSAGYRHFLIWLLGMIGLMAGGSRVIQSERRRAAAQRELARIRSAVECAAEAIVITDSSGKAVFINRAFTQMFGHSLQEIRETGMDSLFADPSVAGRMSCENNPRGNNWEGEAQMLASGGSEITTWCRYSRIFDSRGQYDGMRYMLTDITEQKKAQQAYVQNEKFSAVLELAGAACHEINQPLQAALGYSEIALLEQGLSTDNGRYSEFLQLIHEQVLRVAIIVKKLHGLSRYRTAGYVGRSRILDIEQSSSAIHPPE